MSKGKEVENDLILKTFLETKSIRGTGRKLSIAKTTIRDRLMKIDTNIIRSVRELKVKNVDKPPQEVLAEENFELKKKLILSRREMRDLQQDVMTAKAIRETCFGLAGESPEAPKWMFQESKGKDIGVPTLALGDFHWEEVVDPAQVDDLNEYNHIIAADRFERVIKNTIELCFKHIRNDGKYPGIVVPLLGDFFSGMIHLELLMTNSLPVIPALLDLFEKFISAFELLLENFDNIFVPCVSGNHSRNTVKIHAKDYNYLNYDWLMYSLLDKHFKDEPRIKFSVSSGPDNEYKIYDHTYRMSHGNQFRGGDSIIGPLGPVTRGDNKKRGWSSQVKKTYETALYGHFHRYIHLQHVIINGSLIGRNEYAHGLNCPFEPPMQALWMTHPQRGITISAPVQAAKLKELKETNWVSWKN